MDNEMREPEVAYGKKKFTIEEYLAYEDASTQKHEYFRGEIFKMYGHRDLLAMSGASFDHNEIFSALFGELARHLKGQSCRPFGPDLRIYIPENSLFTYPDISIFCGYPTKSAYDRSFTNPAVIFEILSPSTRRYDRGEKFELYKDIPTLKEYVLIDSRKVHAEVFRRNEDHHWEGEESKTLEDSLHIHAIQFSIPLSELYMHTSVLKLIS